LLRSGQRDGRISETLRRDYTPARQAGFDAEKEWQELHARVAEAEKLAESPKITEELRARRWAGNMQHAGSKALRWRTRFARTAFDG